VRPQGRMRGICWTFVSEAALDPSELGSMDVSWPGEETLVPRAQPPTASSIRQIAILNDVIREIPGAKRPDCLEEGSQAESSSFPKRLSSPIFEKNRRV